MEPVLLGSIANIVINFIFDPANPDFILKEFLVAIVFAAMLTEVNRMIELKLDKKVGWANNLGKRFFLQLIYLTITLLLLLNIVGNIYIWSIGDDFYSLRELITINLSVFVVAFILTFFKWSIHFYKNWVHAEYSLENTNKQLAELKSEFQKKEQQIELLKGNDILLVDVEDINFVKSELGIVWVYYDTDKAVSQSSLLNLAELLPKHLFFHASRNSIIRRDMILSISPSTYGKISLNLKNVLDGNFSITISRLKAASFRKWYNSTSTGIK
ncbi:LytTR family transcriptional regulator DNA-binding domain-containing protein [Flagellimonas sp.]|uniref:LytTR family transcriptional regulator DNA-binding domain-containing protein n=1 Tax=Flagellimonas sp. TaxID=2058762 RepID=UPI003B5CD013